MVTENNKIKRTPTVMFVCPMYGLGLHRRVYESHLSAIGHLAKSGAAIPLYTGVSNKTNLATAENTFVRAALTVNPQPDYIFWTEQDMVIPANSITHLINTAEENGLDIVSGVYFLRGTAQPCLYTKDFESDKKGYGHAQMITFPKRSLFEVSCCGMGCVLMRTEIFNTLRGNTPVENTIWFDDQEGKHGTDIFFYTNAIRAGFKVWADSRLLVDQIDEDEPKVWGYKDYKQWLKKTPQRSGFINNA